MIRDYSNDRGAMLEARRPHNAALYARAQGRDGYVLLLDWILECSPSESRLVLPAK